MAPSKVFLVLIALAAMVAATTADSPTAARKTATPSRWWTSPPTVYNVPLNLRSFNFTTNVPATEDCTPGKGASFKVALNCVINGAEVGLAGAAYYTGIYYSSTDGCGVNWQITFALQTSCGNYPPGKIYMEGDGTGVNDPGFSDKAIVGGTGWYVGKLGLLTKNGAIYNLDFSKMGA